MKRHLLAISILLLLAIPVSAQKSLFVTLNNSKGYVVGAKLRQSGIFHYESDTSWTHIGWNHPFIGGIAFAGRADGTIHAAAGNGMLRSFDGGETWKITTGWEFTEGQHVAIDRSDRELVYAASSYGIWRSRDGGRSWRQVTETYAQAIFSDIFYERRLIAATEKGLVLSSDGGDTWRSVGPETAMIDVDQSDSHPLEWIAVSRSDGAFRSTDGGETWTNVLQLESEGTAVTIDPGDLTVQAVTTWGQGLFISRDGGKTWATRNAGLPTQVLVAAAFDADRKGRLWVATKEEGIYYTDDLGASWKYVGMTGTMVFDMAFAE